MTPQLTPTEIEELNIAIARDMGMDDFHTDPDDGVVSSGKWGSRKLVPHYTTSIDAIQKAAIERFTDDVDQLRFTINLGKNVHFVWQLSALDWSIAYARTAKIWRYKV